MASHFYSMVPNLNITTTDVDLVFEEIAEQKRLLPSLPAPSIRQTPVDEASGKELIFAMAFPTLYPTGQADFNTLRLRKVDLNDYVQHLIVFTMAGLAGTHTGGSSSLTS